MNQTRILIVDDEANIRLMLRTALTSVGYDIVEAGNGQDALDLIARRVPDVMILDLSMPVMDGLSVLRELSGMRTARKPRVIVLTAYGSIPTAVRATRLGAMDFLEKPIVPDEVREAVEAVLAEPSHNTAAIGEGIDPLAGGYEGVLDRVRKLLRLAQYPDAETLLMKAADLAQKDAPYFNLLGVLFEARREWRLARKFYGKALSVDGNYEPAAKNMRRLYELQKIGKSREAVTLGDETADMWGARLPEPAERH